MNKDAKKAFPGSSTVCQPAYKEGFIAAIALDLPVKFNEWVKDWPFGFKRNDEYHIIMQTIFPHYTTEGYGEPTSKQLYQYWLNNIYNPE